MQQRVARSCTGSRTSPASPSETSSRGAARRAVGCTATHDVARRRARPGPQRLCRVDRGVRHQAARVGLDPVVTDRGPAVRRRPRPPVGGLEAASRRRPAKRVRPGRRQPRRLQPGGRGEPDLERLAVRSERGLQPARAQQRRCRRRRAPDPAREPSRRAAATAAPAAPHTDVGMPAALVQRRMARARKRRGGLEAGRIRVQRRRESTGRARRRAAAPPAPPARSRAPARPRRCRRSRARARRSRPPPPARRARRPPRAPRGPVALACRARRRRASRGTRRDSDPRRSPRQHRRAVRPESGDRGQGAAGAERLRSSASSRAGSTASSTGWSGTPGGRARSTRSTARTPCACRASRWLTAAGATCSDGLAHVPLDVGDVSQAEWGMSEVAHVVVLLHRVSETRQG